MRPVPDAERLPSHPLRVSPVSTVPPSFVAREAERMAQNASGRQAMILNYLAIGCMVATALPVVLHAFGAVFRPTSHLTHAQRLNMERVGRMMDERSMWAGDRRGPEREGGHPDPYPRRM
jgi:hypothetical protein